MLTKQMYTQTVDLLRWCDRHVTAAVLAAHDAHDTADNQSNHANLPPQKRSTYLTEVGKHTQRLKATCAALVDGRVDVMTEAIVETPTTSSRKSSLSSGKGYKSTLFTDFIPFSAPNINHVPTSATSTAEANVSTIACCGARGYCVAKYNHNQITNTPGHDRRSRHEQQLQTANEQWTFASGAAHSKRGVNTYCKRTRTDEKRRHHWTCQPYGNASLASECGGCIAKDVSTRNEKGKIVRNETVCKNALFRSTQTAQRP